MSDRLRKSNRAAADYFEVLVCQYICNQYGVSFKYESELEALVSVVLSAPDGEGRLVVQKRNFEHIKSPLKVILDAEIGRKGKIVDINWIGRQHVLHHTTSDVSAKHFSNNETRFSVKSISKGGTGTLKNIGLGQLSELYHIDFSSQNEEMWEVLRNHLAKPLMPKGRVKKIVKRNKTLLEWATVNGQKYQKQLNRACFEAFNKLSLPEKKAILNLLLDVSDKDLYVIIVNSNGAIVYQPNITVVGTANQIVAIDQASDVGYTINIDTVPTYRVQTNNTNGIGISAFCQRFFLVDKDRH